MLLFEHQTRCLKSEAQALIVLVRSRVCFIEIYIDNQCKIIIWTCLANRLQYLPQPVLANFRLALPRTNTLAYTAGTPVIRKQVKWHWPLVAMLYKSFSLSWVIISFRLGKFLNCLILILVRSWGRIHNTSFSTLVKNESNKLECLSLTTYSGHE